MQTEPKKQGEPQEVEVRVSGSTSTKGLAQSLASLVREGRSPILVVIGASALGQAMKAVPILNGLMAPKELMYTVLPSFEARMLGGDVTGGPDIERTAMRLRLIPYHWR